MPSLPRSPRKYAATRSRLAAGGVSVTAFSAMVAAMGPLTAAETPDPDPATTTVAESTTVPTFPLAFAAPTSAPATTFDLSPATTAGLATRLIPSDVTAPDAPATSTTVVAPPESSVSSTTKPPPPSVAPTTTTSTTVPPNRVSTTAAPTTIPPTSQPPTTVAPTTVPPTVAPPTVAPTTVTPTTAPPRTEPPPTTVPSG